MSASDNLQPMQFPGVTSWATDSRPDLRMTDPGNVRYPKQQGIKGKVRIAAAHVVTSFMSPNRAGDFAEAHGLDPVRQAYGRGIADRNLTRHTGLTDRKNLPKETRNGW